MATHSSKTLAIALALATFVASCGGSDTTTRQRNAALPGAQQCLSDEGTTIDANGLVQLDFCSEATTYEIRQGNVRVAGPISIEPDSLNKFQAPPGQHVFQVVAFNANNEMIAEDVVNTVTDSCATGGACDIGDIGPGGGIVIYDAKEKTEWGQYIEMARKGWYDNAVGPNAPADPIGDFQCVQDKLGTSNKLGSGKTNSNKFAQSCQRPAGRGPSAIEFVNEFNTRDKSGHADWVIPALHELTESNLTPDLLSALELPDSIATSVEVPYEITAMFVYEKDMAQYSAQCESGCAYQRKDSSSYLRPIRYFSSDGPVTPTVSVTGIMPTQPSTSIDSSSNQSPIDVNIEGAEELKITWKSDGNNEEQKFIVEFRGLNGKEESTGLIPCCEKTYSFDLFEPNVEFTFVVSRVDDNGNRVSSAPISLMPVLTIGDSEGQSHQGTSNKPQEQSPAEVDCSVAPNVDFPRNQTTDDTVKFVVTHPCFGKYTNQRVNFGRVVIGADGNNYRPVTSSRDVVGTSYSVEARFEKGIHAFEFLATYRNGNEFIYSQTKKISFEITQGNGANDNKCDLSRLALDGETLRLSCPVFTRVYIEHNSTGNEIESQVNGDELSADLSGLPGGWHFLSIFGVYGLEVFVDDISVCVSQCDEQTFVPFEVKQENDTLTASLTCKGYMHVYQMYKVSNQIYVTSARTGSGTGELKISVSPSTAALQFIRSCEEEKREWLFTFGLLGRSSTPSGAEDVANNFKELIATISLPEITQGVSDFPVGEVSGGSIAVAAEIDSLSLTPDALFELLNLTIAGSKVKTVEISADGENWIPSVIGDVELRENASKFSVRLTAENGSQTVITRDIDRSASSSSVVDTTTDSGINTLTFVLIALALLLLLAVAAVVRKKRI